MKFRGPKAPIDILRGPVFGGWVSGECRTFVNHYEFSLSLIVVKLHSSNEIVH
jgi:hypothetical protein